MRILILFTAFITATISNASAGKKINVLFIGNSYIHTHGIPGIVAEIAKSTGDTLIYDMNAPGGQSFGGHLIDVQTQGKIKAGGWDYVVLQEQSQIPSFPDAQVQMGFFPPARKLDSIVRLHNQCGKTMFYMTWGRENGDYGYCPVYPLVCTYTGMDSLLRLRYMMAADSNDAEVSPVGAVWRFIRSNYPAVQLYEADESHPSQSGAYAAACSFYAALFRKDPLNINYNYSLSATDAVNIRTAAKKVVFDSLTHWHIGEYDLVPSFSFAIAGNTINFTNQSANAISHKWDFGDTQTSTQANPAHTYAAPGIYNVKLTVADKYNCEKTFDTSINLFPATINEVTNGPAYSIYPNPSKDVLNISTPNPTKPYQVQILNALGQKTYSTEKNENGSLNVSALPAGVYTLIVSDGKGISHLQFIKQ